MKSIGYCWLLFTFLAICLVAAEEERLGYSVNWASGLSLGEVHLTAAATGERRELTFRVDAAIPGYPVADRLRSVVNGDFCSVEAEKETLHGTKKSHEITTFDAASGKATRKTIGGGSSELSISPCPRDAVAFLYFARRELAQGRVPPAQTVYFGGPYHVKVEFGGVRQVQINDERVETERLVVNIKGPVNSGTFEVFFARDARRTPVMATIPLAIGTLSVEIVR
jgi:hypothetical protein